MNQTNLIVTEAVPDLPLAPPPGTERPNYFSTEHLRPDLRGRALRGTSVTVVGQACTYGIATIGTIIPARLLTPQDFGLVTMALYLSLLLQNFGTNGFLEATIQRESIHQKQISTLHWINVACSGVLTLLFVAAAPAIAWLYHEPLVEPVVRAIAITILLGSLGNQHQALLRRNMQFSRIAAIDVASTFISITVAILLAWRGWGYWALVARWIVCPLVAAVGAWLLCGWRPSRPARGTGVRPMLKFALNTYGNYVLLYFTKTMDKLLVGRFNGSQALGNYDRAYQLSNMLPSQLLSPLNSVAMSAFSRLSSDKTKYRHTYLNLLSILTLVSMPASALLTVIGHDLILFLLGAKWESAGRLFSVFGVSIGVMMMYYTSAWLHLSLGTPDRWLKFTIISFVLTAVLFMMGLHFGPLGIAWAYSIALYLLTGPALWYAGRPINLTVGALIRTVWKPSVIAVVAGGLSWLALNGHLLTAGLTLSNLALRIAVGSTLCIGIYVGLTLALSGGSKPFSELIRILRDMRPIGASAR
jgi:O-antigen/teichoic acid export membrane protein